MRTQGLALDNGLRLQIIWSKINWLTGAINLTPWYLTYTNPSPTTPVGPESLPT